MQMQPLLKYCVPLFYVCKRWLWIVQDLMDAQIIPADTDFRMFSYRYFGSLPGIDVAFLLDSSAYHTHEDAPHRIRPGTLQVNPIRYPFP